jgi:hypothetical protein
MRPPPPLAPREIHTPLEKERVDLRGGYPPPTSTRHERAGSYLRRPSVQQEELPLAVQTGNRPYVDVEMRDDLRVEPRYDDQVRRVARHGEERLELSTQPYRLERPYRQVLEERRGGEGIERIELSRGEGDRRTSYRY